MSGWPPLSRSRECEKCSGFLYPFVFSSFLCLFFMSRSFCCLCYTCSDHPLPFLPCPCVLFLFSVSVGLSACLSVRLSVRPSARLPACLPVSLSAFWSAAYRLFFTSCLSFFPPAYWVLCMLACFRALCSRLELTLPAAGSVARFEGAWRIMQARCSAVLPPFPLHTLPHIFPCLGPLRGARA